MKYICPMHGTVEGTCYDMENHCYLCPICHLEVEVVKRTPPHYEFRAESGFRSFLIPDCNLCIEEEKMDAPTPMPYTKFSAIFETFEPIRVITTKAFDPTKPVSAMLTLMND